jgi:SAM-dependent methyltransferase
MTYEPSSLEIWITTTVGRLASSTYRAYIDRLPLKGNERVLELGPSAGNSTRHLAKRLLAGGGCVTAVDVSERWIEVAERQLRGISNVELRLGDIGALGDAETRRWGDGEMRRHGDGVMGRCGDTGTPRPPGSASL